MNIGQVDYTPDTLTEVIWWAAVTGSLALISIILIAYGNWKLWRWLPQDKENDALLGFIVSGISLAIMGILFKIFLSGLQAIISPKLFLLEYMSGLLKG